LVSPMPSTASHPRVPRITTVGMPNRKYLFM
jgi:hypothetical protein